MNSFLIGKASRFDIKGKRIFEIGEKYYFENLGIRNSIVGYHPDDQSKLIENVVFNHLILNGYKVHVGQFENLEIDFVASRENEIIYIQAALRLDSENTIEREFGNLEKIKDNYPKIVVTLDPTFSNTRKGIMHLSLRDFLSNKPDNFKVY